MFITCRPSGYFLSINTFRYVLYEIGPDTLFGIIINIITKYDIFFHTCLHFLMIFEAN